MENDEATITVTDAVGCSYYCTRCGAVYTESGTHDCPKKKPKSGTEPISIPLQTIIEKLPLKKKQENVMTFKNLFIGFHAIFLSVLITSALIYYVGLAIYKHYWIALCLEIFIILLTLFYVKQGKDNGGVI